MEIDSFYLARAQVVKCIKGLRYWKRQSKTDSLVCFMMKSHTRELLFFFKHRHNLDDCKTNGFGKYILD